MSRVCVRCGNRDHDVKAKTCRVCGGPIKAQTPGATARSGSGYHDVRNWQRHIIQRLGAPPVELNVGETFVFGRSSESDLKINSPKISRKHAEVWWDEEMNPVLRDLGSENGTLVDGKPIRDHKLQDNDEIAIGPFNCTYRKLQGRSSIRAAQDLLDSQADTQSMMAVAMSGDLKDMGAYELLETLSYNGKTGTLEIYTPKGAEGSVVLQEGLPLAASCGKLDGERAIYHMLGWKEGQYRFVAGFDPDLQPNIWLTMQDILTRAQRRDRAKESGTGSHGRHGPGKSTTKRSSGPPPGKGRRTGKRPPPKKK